MISVIIPTYKPGDYLWECLDSMNHQTLAKEKFRVLLVLNGPQEPYVQQIERYIQEHPQLPVKFIRSEKPGVSHARNLALDEVQTKYLTFLDDDDYLSPVCLEEMLTLADEHSVVECYPYGFMDGKPSVQCKMEFTEAYEYCVAHQCHSINSTARRFFYGSCMKLFPASFMNGKRFDTSFRISEDDLFMFLISKKIKEVRYTSREAIYYRRYREGSTLTSRKPKKEILYNNYRCIWEYTKMFFTGKGTPYLYATRVVAVIINSIQIITNRDQSELSTVEPY